MTPQALTGVRPPARSIESVLENRWARLLVPSLSDLFFLAILAWLFSAGAAGWQSLLADGDAGWHIRTGEYILDHHAVPRADLYSFSKPGAPWYAWEWLTDVIDASLHRWAALKGIVLGAAVIISLFATTLMRRMVWRNAHLLVAMLIALLGVGASSMHFLARPHVFTLLLLSVSVWMIEADRRRPTNKIWLLVPITMVWTNLHGGFLALIAVLGLTGAGTALEIILDAPAGLGFRTQALIAGFRGAARYLALAAACGAASLVNPYGWNLHKHVVEYLRSDWIRNAVQEFQSPSFRNENMLQFELLMLAGLIAAGARLRRRHIVDGLWILFWIHMSLGSVRHVPIFVTVAAPILAEEIGGWWSGWTAAASKGSLAGIINQMSGETLANFRRTSVLPFIAVAVLAAMGPPVRWPADFPDALFPTEMAAKHRDLIYGRRVLTTDQWADYLIYKNPGQKVYADGRSDFYGPEIGNEYIRLLNGGWDWLKTLDKYQFATALVPIEQPVAQLLKLRPDWRVVEDNGKQILLVRSVNAVPPDRPSQTGPRF
jgi:hypothetical protein